MKAKGIELIVVCAKSNERLMELFHEQVAACATRCAGHYLPEAGVHPAHHGEILERIWKGPLPVVLATHSEHMILHIKAAANRGEFNPEFVWFVVDDEAGGTVELHLDSNGRFKEAWPGGFFPERRPMLLELLNDRSEG